MRTRRPPKKRTRKSPPPKEAILTIEGALPSGDGMSGDIAVPFAMPGEEVRAAITGKRADVLERMKDAPGRQPAQCQHFGRPGDACGGCTLQHWGEDAVRDLKRDRLLREMRKDYPEAELSEIYASPPLSRRRAKFSITAHGVGFHRLSGGETVNLRECTVLCTELFGLLKPLGRLYRDLMGEIPSSFSAQATLTETGIDLALEGVKEADLSFEAREKLSAFADEQDLARLSADGITAAERRMPRITLGGVPVGIPAGVFLQATREGEEALIREVMAAASDAQVVADLFCGLGTFALPLSEGRRVLAADGFEPATRALETASKMSGRDVTIVHRDLFARPLQASELKDIDLAVFDPPRAGALDQARELAAARVPTIVAVSCNPATLARDASLFASEYGLSRMVMVDQFGWSPHIEAVAVFRRRT